jgi:hypothetical protein
MEIRTDLMGEAFTLIETNRFWINASEKVISQKFRKENNKNNATLEFFDDNLKVMNEKAEKDDNQLVKTLVKNRLKQVEEAKEGIQKFE